MAGDVVDRFLRVYFRKLTADLWQSVYYMAAHFKQACLKNSKKTHRAGADNAYIGSYGCVTHMIPVVIIFLFVAIGRHAFCPFQGCCKSYPVSFSIGRNPLPLNFSTPACVSG